MRELFEIMPMLEPGSALKLRGILHFMIVGALCAGVLALVYRRISPLKADENEFAATLFILTIAIGLLVSIIKQAPAISFGLFGAMSIVRFRSQIKKPRRMVFLFMATAIGVCCGAGEFLVTIVGTLMLSAVSLMVFQRSAKDEAEDADDDDDDAYEKSAKKKASAEGNKGQKSVLAEVTPLVAAHQSAAQLTEPAKLTPAGPNSKNVQVYPGGRKHRRR